jgi:hypothetical protein
MGMDVVRRLPWVNPDYLIGSRLEVTLLPALGFGPVPRRDCVAF